MISQIHELAVYLGFTTDFAQSYSGGFWSTPIGLFITFTMFVCSCINIWYDGIDDNCFDRIFYSLMALTMLCAFLVGINPDTDPHFIVQSMLYLFCLRFIASVVVKVRHHRRTGQKQKTKCL